MSGFYGSKFYGSNFYKSKFYQPQDDVDVYDPLVGAYDIDFLQDEDEVIMLVARAFLSLVNKCP